MQVTGAEIIVSTIKSAQRNVKVFCLPGGPAGPLIDAFVRGGVEVIFMAHEQACAMACDGYSRSGGFGVLLVTNGPGVTNAVTGVLGAFQDSIPMLILSGGVSSAFSHHSTLATSRLRQYGVQDLNTEAATSYACKWFQRIQKEAEIMPSLEHAFRTMFTDRKGPVWLEVPIDLQNQKTTSQESTNIELFAREPLQEGSISKTSKAGLKAMVQEFLGAKKPIVVLGGGYWQSNDPQSVRDQLLALRVPIVTTWGAVDAIDFRETNYLGSFGILGRRAANSVIQEADFVLALGSRLSIPNLGYNFENFAPKATKFVVDVDRHELAKPTLRNFHPLAMRLESALKEISNAIEATGNCQTTTWLQQVARIKREFSIDKEYFLSENGFLDVYDFSRILSVTESESAVLLAVDMGLACTAFVQSFEFNGASRLIRASGLSSMGYALPAAIGAALAKPLSRVVSIAGDGAMQMNIQELQTLVHHDLPVKVFCLNSRGMLAIEVMQQNQFEGRLYGSRAEGGYSTPDFAKIAEAYGLRSRKVSSISDLQEVLASDEYCDSSPLFVEIAVSHSQRHRPRVMNYRDENGEMRSGTLSTMWPPAAISTQTT